MSLERWVRMSRRKKLSTAQPLLLSIPEVAASLGLGRTKVYELIAHEGLPWVKFGTARRVSMISLQKWIEQREQQTEYVGVMKVRV